MMMDHGWWCASTVPVPGVLILYLGTYQVRTGSGVRSSSSGGASSSFSIIIIIKYTLNNDVVRYLLVIIF